MVYNMTNVNVNGITTDFLTLNQISNASGTFLNNAPMTIYTTSSAIDNTAANMIMFYPNVINSTANAFSVSISVAFQTTTTPTPALIEIIPNAANGTTNDQVLISANSNNSSNALMVGNGSGNMNFIGSVNSTFDDGSGNMIVKAKLSYTQLANSQTTATAPTTITVGASPFTYTNTTGYDIVVYVINGAGITITLSGVEIESTAITNTISTFVLAPNDTLEVAYTTAPTMYYKPM